MEQQTPQELQDRRMVDTPIGPVCMSRTEYEMYQEQLALRQLREADENAVH